MGATETCVGYGRAPHPTTDGTENGLCPACNEALSAEVDTPGPTLAERAQAAQDAIGWARMPAGSDGDGATASDFACGTLNLARVVVDMARRIERLEAALAEARDTRT